MGKCFDNRKRKLHIRTNESGFSFVEMIIVLAIIGLLAGGSVSLIGHLFVAKTEDTAKRIDTRISKLQVESMSKTAEVSVGVYDNKQYLYIYKRGDSYYMAALPTYITDETTAASTLTDTAGTKISDSSVTIYRNAESSSNELKGNDYLRITYLKDGIFDYSEDALVSQKKTNVEKIIIKGRGTYTITLVKETGKHVKKRG